MSCNVENFEEITSNPTLGETGIFKAIMNWWNIRIEHRTNRAAFQHVLGLDDDMLKDIGVTRDDVNWANKLPIEQNASLELQRVAALRNRTML